MSIVLSEIKILRFSNIPIAVRKSKIEQRFSSIPTTVRYRIRVFTTNLKQLNKKVDFYRNPIAVR